MLEPAWVDAGTGHGQSYNHMAFLQAALVLQSLFFLAGTGGDFCWNRLQILLQIINWVAFFAGTGN